MRTFHLISILASLACSAGAAEQTLWDGSMGGQCASGGSWWSFGDHDSTSFSNFPETGVGDWIDSSGGVIDLTYRLEYSTNGYAYYGIGFNFTDPEKDTPQTWTQICVEYQLTGTARVAFQLKNFHEVTHDNDYEVILPRHTTMQKSCFTPDRFQQPRPYDTDGTVFPIDTLLTILRGIKFVANGSANPGTPLVSRLILKSITTIEPSAAAGERILQDDRLSDRARRILSGGAREKGDEDIRILDLQGRLVNVRGGRSPSGVYLATIRTREGLLTRIVDLP